jgi:hypothetical protein
VSQLRFDESEFLVDCYWANFLTGSNATANDKEKHTPILSFVYVTYSDQWLFSVFDFNTLSFSVCFVFSLCQYLCQSNAILTVELKLKKLS